uniref:VWFD domain-containing protein n=1 Tax=Megaselia scalaris TaxID=36166 RepID=T1GYZ7_MEGSC
MVTNEFYSSSSSEEFYENPGTYSLYITHAIDGILSKTPKSALCATWGGVNIKTFDGIVYKSPLSCSHTLVSDKVDGTFDVILKACPYGSDFDCPHVIKIFWQSIIYTIENIKVENVNEII